jgi:hypothetical protein
MRPAGSMVITMSASLTASATEAAGVQPAAAARSRTGFRQVEGVDRVPGLGLIGGHAAAHVAQADEGDAGHADYSLQMRTAPHGRGSYRYVQLTASFEARFAGASG